jgi:hypothetical protein
MAAAQLKVPSTVWSFYPERDQTRREHLPELQEQFGYQAFTVAHHRRFVRGRPLRIRLGSMSRLIAMVVGCSFEFAALL